jgi:ABC-type uncharacterized transport system substrate-binding protein
VRERPDALFVGPGAFFSSRRVQITQLAARYAIPATYSVRQFAKAGGLMSYSASSTDAWRQVGAYVGQAARVLGLDVPPMLLARADEVIERSGATLERFDQSNKFIAAPPGYLPPAQAASSA